MRSNAATPQGAPVAGSLTANLKNLLAPPYLEEVLRRGTLINTIFFLGKT